MSKMLIKINFFLLFFAGIALNAQVSSTCVAKYYFNDGTAEDGIGDNDGIVYGAIPTTDRFGNENHAFYFDGIDDWVDFGDKPEFQFGAGDFSFSFWIKLDFDSPRSSIFAKVLSDANLNFNQYSLWYDTRIFSLVGNVYSDDVNEEKRVLLSDNFTSANWIHIAIVHTNTSSSFYVNGIVEATSNALFSDPNFDIVGYPLVLGKRYVQDDFHFKGTIDDACIFRKALNDEEISELFKEKNPGAIGLEVELGDLIISTPSQGIVLRDELGQCWKITITKTGVLNSVLIECP